MFVFFYNANSNRLFMARIIHWLGDLLLSWCSFFHLNRFFFTVFLRTSSFLSSSLFSSEPKRNLPIYISCPFRSITHPHKLLFFILHMYIICIFICHSFVCLFRFSQSFAIYLSHKSFLRITIFTNFSTNNTQWICVMG